MNKVEQKEMMDLLSKRMEETQKALEQLKESFAEPISSPVVTPNETAKELTLDDIYYALKKYDKAYVTRLKHAFAENNITNIYQLLIKRPREIRKMNNIGITTIYYLREAIEDLGIIW